jgi:hypothetical protein
MKKYIDIKIGSIILLLCLFSCVDDNGNYTYEDVNGMYPAKIVSGIEQNYEIMVGDTLVITPEFSDDAKIDESNYEYLWFNLKRDTLGHERKLVYPVHLKSGGYTLYFRIKDKQKGTMKYYSSYLRVTTEFSQGWFLTKELENGVTDLDFIKYEGKYLPNIIDMVNGEKIPGKPVKTTFAYTSYGVFNDKTNSIESRPTFIVATESNIWSLNGVDMSIHFRTNNMFIEVPDVINPYDMGTYYCGTLNTTILVNNGKFHWMTCGITPARPMNDGRYTENLFQTVDINKYVCKTYSYPAHFLSPGILLFFDNTTNSFRKVEANMYVTIASLKNFSGTSTIEGIPNCNNMPYDLVYMKEYSMVQGMGIMRSKSDGKYYGFKTVDVTPSAVTNPFDAFVPVPAEANVATAVVRCVNKTNSTIYSSSGDNRVFAYKVGGQGDAGGTETQILTLAPDEKVTYLEDIRYTAAGGGIEFSHLVVLTSQGDNWNMYCYNFTGSSDNINPTPVKTYSGKGKAVHVLYRGLSPDPCF